jgi:hypothetical protein
VSDRPTSVPALTPLDAAVALGRQHGIRVDEAHVLKDGSNLLVHLRPAPVVIRVATFTAWVRTDPVPYLRREVELTRALTDAGAPVAPASELLPPGPHVVDGWAMSATAFVEHEPGVVPSGQATLVALDELHRYLRRQAVHLPLLGPARDDLDLAWAALVRAGLLADAAVVVRRGERDRLVEELLAAAPEIQPLHGDAFPRNSLLGPGGVVWIDFEDACTGPVAWDHAVLIRQGRAPDLEPILRERDGDRAIDAAMALRGLQGEAWSLLHEARASGALAIPSAGWVLG